MSNFKSITRDSIECICFLKTNLFHNVSALSNNREMFPKCLPTVCEVGPIFNQRKVHVKSLWVEFELSAAAYGSLFNTLESFCFVAFELVLQLARNRVNGIFLQLWAIVYYRPLALVTDS